MRYSERQASLAEKRLEDIRSEPAVPQNLLKQTRPDHVTRVHRHNSHTSIFVSQKMVAPTDSNEPKPARTNAVTTCFPVTRGALLMQQR